MILLRVAVSKQIAEFCLFMAAIFASVDDTCRAVQRSIAASIDCLCGPSSWAYDSGSTPGARALPDKAAERLVEMRLIRQSAADRDLGERQVGLQHQALRALNSPAHHIRVRWCIEALSKGSTEMGHTQLRYHSQIHRADCRV